MRAVSFLRLIYPSPFQGAMAVVDGNVMAINPADEPRTHMFIWNNIFFSLGFDVKDHYKVGLFLPPVVGVSLKSDLPGARRRCGCFRGYLS